MRQHSGKIALVAALFGVLQSPAWANVTLPAIFGDHMVLQQNASLTVWGWGRPLEDVSVTGSWDRKTVRAKTDNHANWHVKLDTPAAGGPYTLTILGSNTIVLEDVFIGEVWLCSGQSNMEWRPRFGIDNGTQEILQAHYPALRLFQVAQRSADGPQLDVAGQWATCRPETMIDFSAVAYFFGRELYQHLQVPIGLIESSWGGTPVQAWMNPKMMQENEEFVRTAAKLHEVPWCPVAPGSTYFAMIAPLTRYPIAGVIWYQGEGNTYDPLPYERLFPALISNWRGEWGKELPFYYVQIGPFRYDKPDSAVWVREAQRLSLRVPSTGMVVISDIGHSQDNHPRNKRDVGKRLANWALARTYGKEGIAFSGPLYREMKREEGCIRLFFDYAERGLVCRGERLSDFQIAGADKIFVEAQARIDGNSVIVSAPGVKDPVAVRFAWSNTAEPNLFNTEGLPASCFRIDGDERMHPE